MNGLKGSFDLYMALLNRANCTYYIKITFENHQYLRRVCKGSNYQYSKLLKSMTLNMIKGGSIEILYVERQLGDVPYNVFHMLDS